jgi:pyruvate formate lyase activating enzyme
LDEVTMQEWKQTFQPARLEERLPDGSVRCHLSPRNCVMREGQHGFCGVRGNRGGRLVTFNYGKSVHATEETIETEAVNHFAPGARILSMGNIGCMLNCAYCHNWKTSQAKYAEDADIYRYTPEDVVSIAQRHGIRVISWTYNDPVVWHEFVCDASRLARNAGMVNLFKSAFFITPEAVEQLLPTIDIFSISVKSMDPLYYRKYTTGSLEPVLEATRQVYRADKHVEISTLMITDISDNEQTARAIAGWALSELDASVPLHFVRFHPDYRMRDTVRTPVARLIRAREIATSMGAEHVYLGNVYDTPWSDTRCNGCGALLVSRYGLNAKVVGLDGDGRCVTCRRDAHVKRPLAGTAPASLSGPPEGATRRVFSWRGDIRSVHVQVKNRGIDPVDVGERRLLRGGGTSTWRDATIDAGESYRFIVAKSCPDEAGCEVAIPQCVDSNLHEVFDRAHFPTVAVEEAGLADSDVSPLPFFRANRSLTVTSVA